MEITIQTVKSGENYVVIPESEVANYEPLVKAWWFKTKPYTGRVATDLAKNIAQSGISGSTNYYFGVACGLFLARTLIEDWNRTTVVDGVEQKLPITDENKMDMPPSILFEFRNRIEGVSLPTADEVEAAKNASRDATKTI